MEFISNNKEDISTLATIIHDLKNPIIGCEKAIYLLEKERFGELNDTQHEILKMCFRSLSFSKYLINNILSSYKNSQQHISLYLQELDLAELTKECIEELSVFSQERNIQINLSTTINKFVFADKNEIKRVILNLIFNAISNSPQNENIEIITTNNKETVSFIVTNIGNYIPQEQLKTIFNKNISIKNRYNKASTGLGLYLSKEIILAHGGEIIAKSYKNNKNIFGFKLKLHKALETIKN